ncbi:VWA domain-containing protein [Piscinibacter sp. XHJ-5]|uniref:VWA domain-containing protein n=1 Tax=Piscinibacter sp. XHJ-5 TaxID=3037797 RepID=UPI0024531D55|nr:VWA domain-containing protein [Piscinibacter sp. XHJ-5]
MHLQWSEILWLETMLPVLALGCWALLRKRAVRAGGRALQFLARNASTRTPPWHRFVAPALLFGVLALLIVAAARPSAMLTLPTRQQTLILAMDISGSMEAPDVAPSRIAAAQQAAKAFAARLPRHVRVGVVAYADDAQLVQPPTARRNDVMAAIDRLQPQQGTAIGRGILVALAAVFPGENLDAQDALARTRKPARSLGGEGRRTAPEGLAAVPPGSYSAAAIVLLTDGQNTAGPEPVEAAQLAAKHGVKVYTVGFGTKEGVVMGDGVNIVVRLDEDALKQVAELTRGEYFHADSGTELDRVYAGLHSKLVMEMQDMEVTSLFTAGAAALLLLATAISVWKNQGM